jgi:predicted CxxxxCH...CXXCH cytochrome family protein
MRGDGRRHERSLGVGTEVAQDSEYGGQRQSRYTDLATSESPDGQFERHDMGHFQPLSGARRPLVQRVFSPLPTPPLPVTQPMNHGKLCVHRGLPSWCSTLLHGWTVALLLVGAGACDTARTAVPGYPTPTAEIPPTSAQCRACHGNEQNAAPPRGAHGQTSTTDRGVGAHQIHVRTSGARLGIACETCHVVPKTVSDHGHIDDADFHATVQFSGMALAQGATATYDDKNLTCAVYCHGSTLKAPGPHSKPVWTQVDGQQRSCGSCHGAPPPAPHPTSQDCAACHAATAGPGMTIAHADKHIDGHVDIVLGPTASCSGCHGAPPVTEKHPKVDATSCGQCHAETVGAKTKLLPGGKHMDGKVQVTLAANASCSGCHGAPPTTEKHPKVDATSCGQCHAETVDAANQLLPGGKHMDGKVQVSLAATVSCTACHASPPVAGKHPTLWVEDCSKCHAATVDAQKHLVVGGKHLDGQVEVALAPATCNACHGAPPTEVGPDHKPHPNMTRCEKCHTATVDASGKILIGGAHLNGKVDTQLPTSCEACHGAPGSGGAPAPDHNGNTDPSLPGVGAHAAHLKGKTFSKGGIACTSCHVLPATVDAPGHMFGASTIVLDKASTWQGNATFDQPTQTCSAVGCHGAAWGGGSVPQPKWTMTTLACDACHGLPPAAFTGHVQTDPALGTKACATCHKKTVKPDGSLDLEGGYHVNGWVDP